MFGVRGPAVIVAIALGLAAAACGGDNSGGATATTAAASAATTTPEQKQSTDAQVAAGLKALPALVDVAAAKVSSGDGTAAFAPVEASWRTFEGTVRTKESEIYLAIEDGFANLQKAIDEKDAAKVAEAKTAIVAAANQYLAKHP